MLGGGVGIADHISVGAGAQVAAASGVIADIPDGARYAGYPAQPVRAHFREIATLRALSASRGSRSKSDG
jgi:UDP-3-O-[3-hydroxymyristoyl] glucosamine N-acyltransferase